MVQFLPAVPTFGSQLAEVLTGAATNIGQSLLDRSTMQQLQNPNLTPMQKISLIGSLPKEKAAALAQMYGPMLKEQTKLSTLQNILTGQPSGQISPQAQMAPTGQVSDLTQSLPTEMAEQPTTTPTSRWENLSPQQRETLSLLYPQYAQQMETQSYHQQKMQQQLRAENRASWKEHEKFINEQEDKYLEGKSVLEKLQLQKDLVATGKLVSPPIAALSEAFGIDPLGYNKESQLYSKVNADLLGGFTKWIGTAKSSIPEFNSFLKKFATLKNTDEGKNLILDFQMTEQRMKNAQAQITQDLVDQYTRTGQPLPHNFKSIVNKLVDKEFEKGHLELKKYDEKS